MKTTRLIAAVFVVCLALKLNAQTRSHDETTRLVQLSQKLEGTYQVQVIDSREKVAFPLAMLDSIQAKRRTDKTVYLWLKNNIRISVPSYSEINKKGFVSLPRTAYYSSKNLPNNP